MIKKNDWRTDWKIFGFFFSVFVGVVEVSADKFCDFCSIRSVVYVLCNEEPLWMSLCLHRITGPLQYRGSWKKTALLLYVSDNLHRLKTIQLFFTFVVFELKFYFISFFFLWLLWSAESTRLENPKNFAENNCVLMVIYISFIELIVLFSEPFLFLKLLQVIARVIREVFFFLSLPLPVGFNSWFLYKRLYRCYTTLDGFNFDKGNVDRKENLSVEEFHCQYDGKKPVKL